VYVKDSVPLQVAVEGGAADFVEVLKGTTVVARLSGPSYQYTWDTTQEPEGSYQLTLRATRGSATFTSPAATFVVDRTAPAVLTRTPGTGASNVAVRQTLQVSFGEAVKASTVTDSSVVVSAGGVSIAKTLSLSTDGKTLTLTPTAPLPVASTVSVTLGTPTAPLTDLAGNGVTSSTAWTFSVPAWLPLGGALSAVAGNTSAENVTMKVDKNGNPVVAWAEYDASSVKNIYIRRWNGTTWDDLGGPLHAFSGNTSADRPAMVINSDNHIYLVWDEFQYDGTSINLQGLKWNGTWELVPAFDSVSGTNQRTHAAVTLASSNTPVVVSTTSVGGVGYLDPRFWLNTYYGAWTTNFGIEQPTSSFHDARNAQIATVVAKNSDVVAYDVYSNALGIRGIAVQKSPSSTTLLGGQVVTSPAKGTATQPALVLDGADKPYIAWQECPSGSAQAGCIIHAALWTGAAWQPMGNSVSVDSTDNTTPALVMGNDGKPIVAWSGFASPERSIWVSRWTGSNWQPLGAPLSAATGLSTASFKPALTLDKNGQPLVAWHESDGTVSNIHVYRYNY
jgi:hypothetical protein